VTALVYGWLFMQVPESLIGTAIGTALLPTISEQATQNDTQNLRRSLNTTIRVILALTIPAAVLLITGITPLVNVLGFDEIGTTLVIETTRAYTLGLIAYSLIEVTARAFYAQQNARTPLLTIILTAGTFIALAIPLSSWIGAPGIAMANSAAFTLQLFVMLWLLNKKYPGFSEARSTLRRVIPVSVVSGGLVIILQKLIPLGEMSGILSAALGAGILGIGGVLVLPFIWPEIRTLAKL
jgi:putative peptidoglycan lipid II flippase